MTEKIQKFQLDGQHQQLLDINEDVGFFSADLSVAPGLMDFETPYKIAIINQHHLDSGEPIDFKHMQGNFLGKVKNDKPPAQNYFIAIKSDVPIREMIFKRTLKEITPSEEVLKIAEEEERLRKEAQAQAEAMANAKAQAEAATRKDAEAKKLAEQERLTYLKYILTFFIIIVGAFALYYFYKKQVEGESQGESDKFKYF